MPDNFIDDYLSYVAETEPPYIFHRWCILSSIGAILGRNYYLQFGHQRIYPNLYCLLVGDAGSRKSTAVKLATKLVRSSGYDTFAANKTRLEKFLLDLEGVVTDEINPDGNSKQTTYDLATSQNLWGDSGMLDTREVFISADEWTDFAPRGDTDFYTLLGTLWDWDDDKIPYRHRLKNSRSVSIYQPTVSILGGITPEKFANAFPTEIIGGGFLSRLIIIGGDRSERKYTIPPDPDAAATADVVAKLSSFRRSSPIGASYTKEAYLILDPLYKKWREIDDVRFKSYSQRRFTQLLKLCLIVSAAKGSTEIDETTVVTANSYLSAAEAVMPKALGEFGKSKNSDVANKIMDLLNNSNKPMSAKDIWHHVHKDLDKMQVLGDIMQSLSIADRVQNIRERGWLPKKKIHEKQKFVDWSLLTEEEKVML